MPSHVTAGAPAHPPASDSTPGARHPSGPEVGLGPGRGIARSRVLPVALTLALVFFLSVLIDVSVFSAVKYAAWSMVWWAFGVALVGWRRQVDTFTRGALGAVIGIIGQLANWFVWQSLSAPGFSPVGGVVALAIAVVLLRRRRHRATPVPLVPLAVLWAWAGVTAWEALSFAGFAVRQSRPPGPSTMYQDLYWHLGIVAELKRSLVPQVPQVHSGRLNYHWLSDASMAAGSLGSTTPTSDVALRLWFLPMVSLVLAFVAVVSHRVSRSWRAGVISMIVLAAPASLSFSPWLSSGPSSPFVWFSPSQVFGLVFTLWAVYCFVPVLRGQRVTPAAWAVLVVTVFLCAGAKSSILPVFCGGAAVVFVVMVRSRAARWAAVRVGGVCLLGVLLALPFFAGGAAGSTIRLLSSTRRSWVYLATTHESVMLGHGPFVLPHLFAARVIAVVAAYCVVLVAGYGYALTAVTLGGRWRGDPVPTFLVGSFAASLAAYLLIDHTGMSQAYFPLGALPLLAVLCGWGTHEALLRAENRESSSVRRGLACGLAGGLAAVLVVRTLLGWLKPAPRHVPVAALTVAVLVITLLGTAVWMLRRRSALALGLILGAALLQPAFVTAQKAVVALTLPPLRTFAWTVTPAESRAAAWVRDHAPQDALVATNVHCRGIRTTPGCEAAAYWVSALTERRSLADGWAYSDAAQKAAGAHGLPAVRQPFGDPHLFALNEAAFTKPTSAGLDELRRRGVTWLFADSRAGFVAPSLRSFATLMHRDGPVSVYRLR